MKCRKFFHLLALAGLLLASAKAGDVTETWIQYLSGVDSEATVPWDFKVSGGRRAGEWGTIPVPSNWEMQGFGTYRYHCDWQGDVAPDHTGWYRHTFLVPEEWRGRAVQIVFGGVMTDAEVRINGQAAGKVHQGGFYQFRYEVGDLLRFGQENLLEVTVKKFSGDLSINRAERQSDYWLFGGIFRPVWLEAKPTAHVERVAIDARHGGDFIAKVFLSDEAGGRISAQVLEWNGAPVGEVIVVELKQGQREVSLSAKLSAIKPWSAEAPVRYRVRITLSREGRPVHSIIENFGFRTVELRERDGLYVNGEKVRLKGSNRHTFWPTTGRATSRSLSLKDAQLMKEMNMNAVRSSHYPPDTHFLEVADEVGLYVIDELAGWQKAYDTVPGRKLVEEMIVRDVNHPSVIIWANGNEGGNNAELVLDYHRLDPQKRLVIHPWNNFNGVNTSHYEEYDAGANWFFHGRDVFMPTEFLHGNYDGGAGAGLDDWWSLIERSPLGAGAFIWAFADEGIVREDLGGRIDTANDSAPDGIVGPFREKEGSFYAIRKIWCPVYLEEGELDTLGEKWDKRFHVHNRYSFTALDRLTFRWQLVDFENAGAEAAGRVKSSASSKGPSIPPSASGMLKLDLPVDWFVHDSLRLTAVDAEGHDLYTWTWMMRTPSEIARRIVPVSSNHVAVRDDGSTRLMKAGATEVGVSKTTGRLNFIREGGRLLSLHDGPRLFAGESKVIQIRESVVDGAQRMRIEYDGELRWVEWTLDAGGWLKLDYGYRLPSHAEREVLGVTFSYPEALVTGVTWLGRGPYRVWKNRMKGVEYDVWKKAYNDSLTGVRWDYPEFKGFHADLYWAELSTREGNLSIVTETESLFLGLFTPAQPEVRGTQLRFTRVNYPKGDLSFFHGILPMGNRFHPADKHGPAGQLNLVSRQGGTYRGTLYFKFSTSAP